MSTQATSNDTAILEQMLTQPMIHQPSTPTKTGKLVKDLADRRNRGRGMMAGMISLATVVTVQVISMDQLDFLLIAALCTFAVAIPLLGACIFCTFIEEDYLRTAKHPWFATVASIGTVLPGVGLFFIFGHLAFGLAILFALATLIAIKIYNTFEREMKQANLDSTS